MTTTLLNPVKKGVFKKWHNDGSLLLLGAGNAVLDDTLRKLNDTTIEWRTMGKQVALPTVDGKQYSVVMVSNGCDEFVLVIDDMTASDYSKQYRADTGKQHITVYVVND